MNESFHTTTTENSTSLGRFQMLLFQAISTSSSPFYICMNDTAIARKLPGDAVHHATAYAFLSLYNSPFFGRTTLCVPVMLPRNRFLSAIYPCPGNEPPPCKNKKQIQYAKRYTPFTALLVNIHRLCALHLDRRDTDILSLRGGFLALRI